MATIIISTRKSEAIHHWMMKEYGSWEDHGKDQSHPCALLQRFGGKLELTIEQAKELIESGVYTVSSYRDDEIEGGEQTKSIISRYVTKLKAAIPKFQ